MKKLFTIVKTWKQSKYPSTDERLKKIGLLYSYKKEYFIICENMDEPWGQCAKQSKSDIDKYMYLVYLKPKISGLIGT